jgi:hypothetical protein
MPDAWPHPQPCVQGKKARKQVTTGQPKQSGTPCATVLAAASYSPRGAGLVSPRHVPIITGRLDLSVGRSGPYDLAVRARVARPATQTRPSHPALHVRDDAYAPPDEPGRRYKLMISDFRKQEYFCTDGWTAQIRLRLLMESVFRRGCFLCSIAYQIVIARSVSDEANPSIYPRVERWIASRSLSSGARSRDRLARNDDFRKLCRYARYSVFPVPR